MFLRRKKLGRSFRGVVHDLDFLRRQAIEGVNLLVYLALQRGRIGGISRRILDTPDE
jgi:hypothetical protein